ncbi:hypothetical protein F7725_008496 [Dissostichus mawsoni]|uniref:Ig-like domain-containing protein n=1 Tax=Dissostichus mawsoni TaxID=36200 RepID=A0A7J5Y892_DISMA|nr:hypothetical protein F7725_008496 [Dissostichus mawsoni]
MFPASSTGASYSDSVFQTPPFIMKRSGESVDREINCSHSIPSYNRILWYKQDQHQNMKFLGYLNVKYPYPEDDVYQTEILWRNKGEDATMSCRYTKDASYNQMYWYRQLPGESMEQIMYTKISRKDHDFGGFSSKKVSHKTHKMILLFCTALHVILVSGSSLSDNVSQTPAYMYKNLGEEAVISCSHSIKDYNQILWYKQMKDGQLQFLGYMLATQETPEPGLGMILLFCTALHVILVSGSSLSDNVQQTPAYMYKNLGEEAVIRCSHSIENYDRILWYKQMKDRELQFLGYIFAGVKNPEPGLGQLKREHRSLAWVRIGGRAHAGHNCTLTIEGLSESSSAEFFCAVSLGHTAACHCSSECRNQRDRKRTKTLVCVASGFYPDHVSVSWQVGGGAVSSSGVATDSSALRGDKTYRISSRLRVSASDWFTEGRTFTCRVSFFNGTDTSHHEDTVEGVGEKYLKTTQAAKLSYVVFIVKSSIYGAGVAFLLWRLQPESRATDPTALCLHIMDVIIFKHSFLTVSIFLLWTTGLTDGSDVNQTDILWKTQGDNATMSCRHTKGAGYFQMYWYRQLPGETMELIVFTTQGNKDNHDFGEFRKDKFSATKPDAESGTFTVKDLQPGDKGLYFCAVSQHIKVFTPSVKECSNQKDRKWRKTLVCVASGFYPDHVDPPAVSSSGVATDSSALRGDKTYRISSRLRVSASDWFTEGRKFTCRKYLKTTQAAKLSYVVFIVKSSVYGAGVAFLLWRLQV